MEPFERLVIEPHSDEKFYNITLHVVRCFEKYNLIYPYFLSLGVPIEIAQEISYRRHIHFRRSYVWRCRPYFRDSFGSTGGGHFLFRSTCTSQQLNLFLRSSQFRHKLFFSPRQLDLSLIAQRCRAGRYCVVNIIIGLFICL